MHPCNCTCNQLPGQQRVGGIDDQDLPWKWATLGYLSLFDAPTVIAPMYRLDGSVRMVKARIQDGYVLAEAPNGDTSMIRVRDRTRYVIASTSKDRQGAIESLINMGIVFYYGHATLEPYGWELYMSPGQSGNFGYDIFGE